MYSQILNEYDVYLKKDPTNYKVQLERCKFIENAYFDAYDEYNPNQELAEACADSLIALFPKTPEVRLYPVSFLYQDSLTNYLLHLEDLIREEPVVWQDYAWEVYKALAEQKSYSDDEATIHYGRLAMERNDTLDLSLLVATAYKNTKQDRMAIEMLVDELDSTDIPWELNQKGQLLLDLNVPDKAIEAFQLASKTNGDFEDANALAMALIENKLFDEARFYLLKEYQNSGEWNVLKSTKALLEYDLKYGSADSAQLNYARMTEGNFAADALGVYRLRLFIKSPSMGWSLDDAGRILLLLLCLSITLVIPYLWILPIHYFGAFQKQKGKVFDGSIFHWSLRHFWIASSAWLLLIVASSIFFYYPVVLTYFNDTQYVEDIADTSIEAANANIFFFSGLIVFGLAMLRRQDFDEFPMKMKTGIGAVGVGVGLAFLLRFGLGIYTHILRFFDVDLSSTATGMASINEIIISINQNYNPLLGFLFVVILVPVYEEILFRGIILSSTAKNMTFLLANILQSALFALIHQNLAFFPFYFAFGMMAGSFTRKSGSLITSTSMHMTNNLIAFVAILAMT